MGAGASDIKHPKAVAGGWTLHYTDLDGFKAISSQKEWTFRAVQPRGNNEYGAYFTTLPPDAHHLVARTMISADKKDYIFAFTGQQGLQPKRGGKGKYILWTPEDYVVAPDAPDVCWSFGELAMIGGTDIIIPVRDELRALDLAVRAVIRFWNDVVLEDADTGEVLPAYWGINFTGRNEILAFRDAKAAQQWEDIGPDPSLDGTLIHLLISAGELTVAVDDVPPPRIKKFVEALQDTFRQDMLASTAEYEEAA